MTKEKKIAEAQRHLRALGLDGWLLYDFHRNNYLTHLFLEIPSHAMVTRRFFYWIPAQGDPLRIVHAVEPHVLDEWPGEKKIFLSWQSLEQEVGAALRHCKRVAMEYSPRNGNPYVSHVDGGTIDLVRAFGVEVVSSGSFLPYFTAVIHPDQGESHIRAGRALDRIVHETWDWIAEHLRGNQTVTDYAIQQKILKDFERLHLVTESPPIVGINEHSADPHFEPSSKESRPFKRGDFLLIDLWAKENHEDAIYGDITRVAVGANRPSERQQQVFHAVRTAQKAGIDLVKKRFLCKKQVLGCEVDDAVRKVIHDAGFGPYFLHRTGHSIEVHLHGSGPNIDNLEMHDDRPILPGTCFSIEPGVYLPGEFGIRLESDMYVHLDGRVEVTGGEQDAIHLIS